MATVQQRKGSFRILFVHHGKRETFTLGRVTRDEAEAKAEQVDYLLMRLKQGLITIPPGVDIVRFMQLDGHVSDVNAKLDRHSLTLAELRNRYLKTHANGTLEQTTLDGIVLHFKHLIASLGEGAPVQSLSMADLQCHIDRRATAKGARGNPLSAATIKKEIVTLRTAWNWAVQMEMLHGSFPNKGLRYPKLREKPPFMTWEEISRRINAGGWSVAEIAAQWECLYLTLSEIHDLLECVKASALQPWVYPMFCFAAHTGARRSEMLRAEIGDVDIAGGTD